MLPNESFHYMRGKHDACNDIMSMLIEHHTTLITNFEKSVFENKVDEAAAYSKVLGASDAITLLCNYIAHKSSE